MTFSTQRRHSAIGMVNRLHTIAGLFVAPLLLIAAITGFLYSIAPSLEQVVYREELSASARGEARSVSEQITAAQAVHPDLDFSAVQVTDDPGANTRVLFSDPSLLSSSYRQVVFVDPSSLEIHGDLVQYGSSRALPLRAWISEGHRRLWLGEPGRIYSETAASWLGILSLAGLWLWWSKRNQQRKGVSTRRTLGNAHSSLGIWLLPGFLFLTITGLTWSMVAGTNFATLRSQLDWVEPVPVVSVSGDGHSVVGHHHEEHESVSGIDTSAVDTVMAAARDHGLTGMLDVNAPVEEHNAWVVKESREAWKFATDSVAVDPNTGAIVDAVDFADWPLAAKLSAWLIQLHQGQLLGLLNQLVLATIALGLIAMICLGYAMWWKRGFGRLPAAGQWHKCSPLVLVAIGSFLLIYALVAPLFGISLLAFIVVDALLQRLKVRASRSRKLGHLKEMAQ